MFGRRILRQKFAILLAGANVLKDYLKTLNNNLEGYNIDFFEDEKESIWMMANAYYKLIKDFIRKTRSKRIKKKK